MDLEQYTRFFLALVLVLGLIGLAAWLLRRFGQSGMPLTGAKGRRLRVVETAVIDGRRRLVLLRRDGIEHLVLLGGANDLVIESGIAPSAPPPAENAAP